MTRICCFSPCMEQVLRTVSALNEAGFSDITMYETLLRPHEVNQVPRLATAGEASAQLKEAIARREERRLKQIEVSQLRRAQKRKRGAGAEEGTEASAGVVVVAEGEPVVAEEETGTETRVEAAVKKQRVDDGQEDTNVHVPAGTPAFEEGPGALLTSAEVEGAAGAGKIEERMDLDEGHGDAVIARTTTLSPSSQPHPATTQMIISKVTHEVRGHTSYLTFATLEPAIGTASHGQAVLIMEPEPSQPEAPSNP